MYKLHLNNFRSFVNQDLEFSRINILIGENSSGKSSL
ncbi:MAG: AAA family ATPase, partial [Taibaiella sp.]|nr:AAA family ATPase [Taibaiella sp.]